MALGFYNPLQRLLGGRLNVSGQPERNSAGIINRPNPIKFSNGLPQLTGFQSEDLGTNPSDFASLMSVGGNPMSKAMPEPIFLGGPSAPSQTRQPGGPTYEDMRFTGVARSQPMLGLGQEPPEEMFLDRLTNEQVTKEQVDSLGGMGTFLSPSEKSSVLERDLADFDHLRAAQAGASGPMPYAASVDQVTRGLDPTTQQLLFGLDGKGGFIPGAMRAAERTFFDDQGNPVVIPEQVADLTQDQLDAFQLARSGVGSEGRFLSDAEAAYRSGIGSLTSGLERGLGVTEGATERFRDDLGGVEDIMRGTTRGYDPSMTEQFYNPYEDRVVQQTISDVMDAGDRADIAQTARDIATGGESAFGSRARLTAEERREALGRGLGEALGGIRSRGFTEAQRTGLGEFGRQLASERAAASGLAGLARSGYGAGTALGNLYGNIGQQQMLGQSRLGSALSGLGRQAQTARFGDIQALLGGGNLQQQQAQQQLQASRANALQAQTAPLLQYQSLLPFIQTVPTGAMQTNIGFQPTPSPLQAGLGVGLSALGALGNFMNPSRYYSQSNPYQS